MSINDQDYEPDFVRFKRQIDNTSDKNGDENSLSLTMRDISTQKKQQNEFQSRILAMDNAGAGIALASPDGTLTYINKSFLSLWGEHTAESVLGKNTISFWNDPHEAQGVIESILKNDSWVGKVQAKRRDGSLFSVYCSAGVARFSTGKASSIFASFIDITESEKTRKKLEDEKKQTLTLLRQEKEKLKEMNTALRVVLETKEHMAKENDSTYLEAINASVIPSLNRLRSISNEAQQNIIDSIISRLNTLNSLPEKIGRLLSGRELEIAQYITQGYTSKEIGNMIGISGRSVENYRQYIRNKLGLKNSRKNLKDTLTRKLFHP